MAKKRNISPEAGVPAAGAPTRRRLAKHSIEEHAHTEHAPAQMVSSRTSDGGMQAPDREEIARLAYSYWIERGRQGGSPEDDWYRAEQELRIRRSASAA